MQKYSILCILLLVEMRACFGMSQPKLLRLTEIFITPINWPSYRRTQ